MPMKYRSPVRAACRHCANVRPVRARGLCHACYFTPGIRASYTPISKFGRRGAGLSERRRPLPEPTSAWPGTEEKVQELARRAEQGLELWHPHDAGARDEDDVPLETMLASA